MEKDFAKAVCRTAALALCALSLLVKCGEGDTLDQRLSRTYAAAPRPLPLRLTGYPYTAPAADDSASSLASSALLAAAHAVLASPASTPVRQRTLAYLIAGKPAAAIALLDAQLSKTPAQAELWNARAVALRQLSVITDDPQALVAALASTDRALACSKDAPEPNFNRAAILVELGLTFAAKEQWRSYLKIDHSSPWAEEARHALRAASRKTTHQLWEDARRRLEAAARSSDAPTVDDVVAAFPQEARRYGEGEYLLKWAEAHLAGNTEEANHHLTTAGMIGASLQKKSGESLLTDAVRAIHHAADRTNLAQAHVTYARARMLIRDREPVSAEPLLIDAERRFAKSGSPMALVARCYRSGTLFDRRHAAAASKLLESVRRERLAGYVALEAETGWERSRILGRLGNDYASMLVAQDAATKFMRLGELQHALRTRTEVANKLYALGRPADAWRLRCAIFREISANGTSAAIASAVHGAARDELAEKRFETAKALFDVLLDVEGLSPLLRADALMWRTFAATHSGDVAGPTVLAGIRAITSAIKDPALRAEAQDQARVVEALVTKDRKRALELVTASVEFRRSAARALALAHARLIRAHIYRATGDDRSAATDLEESIRLFEQQRDVIGDAIVRDSFFGGIADACRELADIHTSRGDVSAIFSTTERCHGHSFFATRDGQTAASALPLDEVRQRLRANEIVAHYTVLTRQTVLIAITRSTARMHVIGYGKREIDAWAADLRLALSSDDAARAQPHACAMYRALVAPMDDLLAGRRLVVVADGDLADVPFAALKNPQSGNFLIEEAEIIVSPSANAHVQKRPRAAVGAERHALIVGDPAVVNLRRLPGAAREARTIARNYTRVTLLTDTAASIDAFRREARRSDLIHVAAHALVGSRDPAQSALVFAQAHAGTGLMPLREIASLRLDHNPIVVLAGCQTGIAAPGKGSIRRISSAFLAAGAKSVFASLWNIDDGATLEFSVALHRHLKNGVAPSSALRQTQIEMLRSPDTGLRTSVWSAFSVYSLHAATDREERAWLRR